MIYAVWYLGTCILASAFVIAAAIKAAVETTKHCNVNWNPTVTLKREECGGGLRERQGQ